MPNDNSFLMLQLLFPSNQIAPIATVLNLLDASLPDEKNELKTQAIPVYTKLHVIKQLIDKNDHASNFGLTVANSFSRNYLFTKINSRTDVFHTNFEGFEKSLIESTRA